MLDDALICKIHAGLLPVQFVDCVVTAIEPGNPALFDAGVRSSRNWRTLRY